jgi:hypothetical protein
MVKQLKTKAITDTCTDNSEGKMMIIVGEM